MYDSGGALLYVGKAKNLKKRVSSYFSGKKDPKTQHLVSLIAQIEVTITETEVEAYLLENSLIQKWKPRYNILFRDDKSYPYLLLTGHSDYPRLQFYRGGAPDDGGKLFGPYPSSAAVREALELLQRVFQLRQCDDTFFKNRSRPCLQYQIKRCSAPCVNKIGVQDYQEDVARAVQFLKGDTSVLIDALIQQMESLSSELHFEKAARIRDQISVLRKIQMHQVIVDPTQTKDVDVLGAAHQADQACIHLLSIRQGRILGSRQYFPDQSIGLRKSLGELVEAFVLPHYLNRQWKETLPGEIIVSTPIPHQALLEATLQQELQKKIRIQVGGRGDRAKWLKMAVESAEQALVSKIPKGKQIQVRLKALQEVLKTLKKLERIECFDVSHMQGEAVIAACVVFGVEGAVRSDYRRFNIRVQKPGDDYAALEEALNRHYSHLQSIDRPVPDLILIDGGQGQLAVGERVISHLNLTHPVLMGVAKGPARKPGLERLFLNSKGEELKLSSDSPALHLIQEIRDEAHRFAITGHRNKRNKRRLHSVLEDIPGVGEKRRRELLRQLGGLQEVLQASVDKLAEVPGISHVLAKRIYDAIHGNKGFT